MRRIIFIFSLLLPLLAISQADSLASGVYAWKEPEIKSGNGSTILFAGKTNDLEWLQMSANIILFSKNKKGLATTIPGNEEQLIIVKSGAMNINLGDSSYTIGAGSVVLLLPGEKYTFSNINQTPCSYYKIKYRSKLVVDTARGKSAGGSLVKDWDKTEFKPGEKGGRRNFLERPTAMFKRLEIHVTTLKEGLKSHAPHTHRAAEFTLIKEGQTQMQVSDKIYKGPEGSIFYAPSNVLHALENTGAGNCTYFAIQFE